MRLSDVARKKKFEKRGDGIEKRATKRRDGRMGPPFCYI